MNKFSIIGIGNNLSSQPYLYKLSNVLNEFGTVSYYCWDRLNRAPDNEGPVTTSLLNMKANSRFKLFFGYILWVLNLIFFFLLKADKSTTYFVSRFDAGFPALIGKKLRGINYIYLDRDAAHLTYKFGLLSYLVYKLECSVGKNALRHFVPGESRNFTGHENVRVIENSPNKAFYDEAQERARLLPKSLKKTIYINGWLVNTRGAETILECCRKLSFDDYKIIVAGRLDSGYMQQLVDIKGVEYLGQLSNVDSLSYYFISDIVFSFYDPSIEVNRRAEPNKWYDCLFTKTRFITNKGITTSSPFVEMGLCYEVNYGNVEQLLEMIHKLPVSPLNFIASFDVDFWDVKVRKILQEIILIK